MADFTPSSAAFTGGFDAAQNVSDAWRKTRAMNALNAIYGPTVNSLADVTTTQQNEFDAAANPLKLQAAQQANDFNAQNDPLKIQNQELQNQNQTLANTEAGQKIDANNLSLQGAQALKIHGILSAAATNLGTKLQGVTDPNQRGAIFDQEVQNLAPMVGSDPRTIAAQLRPERDRIVQGGAEAVPQLQSDLDGLVLGSLSPEDRQKLANAKAAGDLTQGKITETTAQTNLANARAKAATDTAAAKTAAAAAKAAGASGPLTPQKAQAVTFFKTAAQSSLTDIDQAIAELSHTNDNPLVRKFQSNVPGTPEYKLNQTAQKIEHSLSILDLRSLKESGFSLGRTSNVEFLAASKALANFDLGQDKATVLENLQRLKGVYNDVVDSADQQLNPADATTAAPAAGGDQTFTFNPATGELE